MSSATSSSRKPHRDDGDDDDYDYDYVHVAHRRRLCDSNSPLSDNLGQLIPNCCTCVIVQPHDSGARRCRQDQLRNTPCMYVVTRRCDARWRKRRLALSLPSPPRPDELLEMQISRRSVLYLSISSHECKQILFLAFHCADNKVS